MNSFAKSAESSLAGDGGVNTTLRGEEDPYRKLDDLMVVVEALCPVWPQRDAFIAAGRMLL